MHKRENLCEEKQTSHTYTYTSTNTHTHNTHKNTHTHKNKNKNTHTHTHGNTHTFFLDRIIFVTELHRQVKVLFEPDLFSSFLFRFFDPINIHNNNNNNTNNNNNNNNNNENKRERDERNNNTNNNNNNNNNTNTNNNYLYYVFDPLQPFDSRSLAQLCVIHKRFPLFFERVCRMYRVCIQLCTDYK